MLKRIAQNVSPVLLAALLSGCSLLDRALPRPAVPAAPPLAAPKARLHPLPTRPVFRSYVPEPTLMPVPEELLSAAAEAPQHDRAKHSRPAQLQSVVKQHPAPRIAVGPDEPTPAKQPSAVKQLEHTQPVPVEDDAGDEARSVSHERRAQRGARFVR